MKIYNELSPSVLDAAYAVAEDLQVLALNVAGTDAAWDLANELEDYPDPYAEPNLAALNPANFEPAAAALITSLTALLS